MARRAQLIESAYEMAKDGKNPDFFHAGEMMGSTTRTSGAVIAEALEAETTARLQKRALIEQQLRRAQGGPKAKGEAK